MINFIEANNTNNNNKNYIVEIEYTTTLLRIEKSKKIHII